ncbi:MAG: HsdM family class I SAM-dependent methyltransferase [Anaerovoracaceae bacterium]
MTQREYLTNIKGMIDDLKAMCEGLGLSNTGDEYKIIAELFTYKFLNDKLIAEFGKREDKSEDYNTFIQLIGDDIAAIPEEYLLDNLFNRQNEVDFHKTLDKAFIAVSEMNKEIYSMETSSGRKKPLFEPMSAYLRDEDKENELAKRSINILCDEKYTFKSIFDESWDYFSSVFEYLIKDYNKDSGKYAEYFTPVFAGKIMANILYNDTPVKKVSVYDPAGGSGTLLLTMANEIGVTNCTIYSQDISQKSSQFLRINLILNKLAHSLHNVIEGNTLTDPQHLENDDLQKFDFIVSNPPFKTDFSASIEALKADKYGRFFAGLPNIPKKDTNKMAIYETFFQHILASLNGNGKAAIVVPTGFITAATGIPSKIRQKIVDNNWVSAVVSMPSNIFANTGTNVSIVFIDKQKETEDVMLVDASNLGTVTKVDKEQRTLLSNADTEKITTTVKTKEIIEDFSIQVSIDEIKEKNYSLSAGQYFDVKIDYVEITEEEFKAKVADYECKLNELFANGTKLQEEINKNLGELKYE